MSFEHYLQRGTQKLRMGFTTGSCAALAAKAAAQMLFTGERVEAVRIMTPKGLPVEAQVLDIELVADYVRCAVQKDAGDDPDVTDGVLVYAELRKTDRPGVHIDGGNGVGRVSRPGLDQPIGAAAINRVPRQMISKEVQAICERHDYKGGLEVTISIPQGARLARRTFNARLGIEGGISVLGTSGIVEPRSAQALLDCIGVELRVLAAEGYRGVMFTPGNYGRAFIAAHPSLAQATVPTVNCSNFIGDSLDLAVACGFKQILLVGHIGKFVKLAGGIMNTHSSVADCRMELLAVHAALAGAERNTVAELMDAISTDGSIEILDEHGLRKTVFHSLLQRIQAHLENRVGDAIEIGALLFSNLHGFLGQTETAADLIASFR
jgi:cobalt-precorrin-5B (C1)-methyltransferase